MFMNNKGSVILEVVYAYTCYFSGSKVFCSFASDAMFYSYSWQAFAYFLEERQKTRMTQYPDDNPTLIRHSRKEKSCLTQPIA